MVRRGSKKHESALQAQEEGKTNDEVEEVQIIEEDNISQKALLKTRRKRQVVSKDDTKPEKRMSKRNKTITESNPLK